MTTFTTDEQRIPIVIPVSK